MKVEILQLRCVALYLHWYGDKPRAASFHWRVFRPRYGLRVDPDENGGASPGVVFGGRVVIRVPSHRPGRFYEVEVSDVVVMHLLSEYRVYVDRGLELLQLKMLASFFLEPLKLYVINLTVVLVWW